MKSIQFKDGSKFACLIMHTLHPINRSKLHEKLSVPSLITVHSVQLISPGQAVKFHLTFSDIKLKVMLDRSACW